RRVGFTGDGAPALRGRAVGPIISRLGEDPKPVTPEGNLIHPAGVRDQDGTARPEVPEPDGPLHAAGRDLAAVGPEGDRPDEVGMTMKCRGPSAGGDFPEPHAP